MKAIMKNKVSISGIDLNIKIEAAENARGTVRWFMDLLGRSELVIKDTESGTPCIFLKTLEAENIIRCSILCKNKAEGDERYCKSADGRYSYVAPTEKQDTIGLFTFPLTPSCEKEVRELIGKAKDVFADWWENDIA
ncbi:MAG TPA: hypothetical protein PLN36_05325 [Bacteroidales bacterium]|nr:hypothetical protein [Bacteroidales bacterium]